MIVHCGLITIFNVTCLYCKDHAGKCEHCNDTKIDPKLFKSMSLTDHCVVSSKNSTHLVIKQILSFFMPDRIEDVTLKTAYPDGCHSYLFDLACYGCKGAGDVEEASGGYKKECDKCYGIGVDPAKIKKYETAYETAINVYKTNLDTSADKIKRAMSDIYIVWKNNKAQIKRRS